MCYDIHMAKTSYINILPEVEDQYWNDITPGDRFTSARVRRKNLLLSKKRKKGVSQRSLLTEIAAVWATLSQEQKDAWGAAGAECNLNSWRLFIKDYCARRVNELSGIATPSLLHQCWVGQIHIEAPATEAKIVQIHPRNYYTKKKVYGTKSMYSPVLVTEDLGFPFTLSLNYKSNLSAAGADPYAKLYARFWYSYQGQNLLHNLEISLDLITDWKNDFAVLANLVSYAVRYDLYIHLHDLQGDLFFDNIKAEHSGQNWVRDSFCDDVDQSFTRNFYQIPKHWSGSIMPDGADFESIYKDF